MTPSAGQEELQYGRPDSRKAGHRNHVKNALPEIRLFVAVAIDGPLRHELLRDYSPLPAICRMQAFAESASLTCRDSEPRRSYRATREPTRAFFLAF